MPVPRLFEASGDPREQWSHILSTLLALGGPDTRTALVKELSGEELPGADAILVREQRPLGDGDALADIVARGAGWTLVVQSSLAFGGDDSERLRQVFDGLAEAKDRRILIVLTPDRREPEGLGAAAADGWTVRHRSWLRVRDWVQERPERGAAEGTALLLLREADYYFTPRVAELYRLEGLMPLVPAALRPVLATIFFDLNELSPAPLIQSEAGAARVVFPRTGDPVAEILLRDGGLSVRLAGSAGGPGFTDAGEGRQTLAVGSPEDWRAARSWVWAAARDQLPARR
jgi:hypothetical protein